MKLCKDCKWAFGASGFCSVVICNHPNNRESTSDRVAGKQRYRLKYCELQRRLTWFSSVIEGTCGKSGRWFEPKIKGE